MTVWIIVSASALALLVVGAYFTLSHGTYSEKFGVVRASKPSRSHYIGEGALFASTPTHEIEVEIDGVIHRCCSNSNWKVGQQVVVAGVQNTTWKALKIER